MAESLPHGHRPKRNPVIYIYIRGVKHCLLKVIDVDLWMTS